MEAAVLIPIKAFHEAKARLAGVLDPAVRARLARWTAARVVDAAHGLPVFVACDDRVVADWSTERGATVLWQAGKGLNAAVDDAVGELARRGCAHVVVVHADLAVPSDLGRVVRAGTRTLVPDRLDDGTNVMSFPTSAPIAAAYGAGSFRRHLAQALGSTVPVEVRRDPWLAMDIDTPDDLLHPLVKEALPPWLPTILANPNRRLVRMRP